MSQFNVNLMTQFNEGKGLQGIRINKYLSLKIQGVSNVFQSLRKKEKQYV